MRGTITEVERAIRTIGESLTVIVQSEPGCGKSAILAMIAESEGAKWRSPKDAETVIADDKYDYIYVDCPVKDMMDVAASIPNHTTRSLEYYVSSLFKLGNGKPKRIMLDEFMKAPKLLKIIFTRLMLERMVGDVPLPEGSIVFGTSNNASDGVGDEMLAHAGNRVCKVSMEKPKAPAWCAWAAKNKIARPIRAWVAMTPKVMASYLDGDQADNPYIFDPKKVGVQYASPRSLAKASVIVRNKDVLGEELMMTLLSGTIGEAAARAMSAFIVLEDKLMPFSEVLKNPTTCKVPDDISVLLMMMMEAIDVIETHDELSGYMDFINRIKSGEMVQSIFFTMICRNKAKLASRNKQVTEWSTLNYQLLA
jgi:hypothetical protein